MYKKKLIKCHHRRIFCAINRSIAAIHETIKFLGGNRQQSKKHNETTGQTS